MKEVLFFTNGDANDANVWSNVPYCFSHALEKKGIIVHRVDYSMNRPFVKFYDLFFRRVLDGITFRKLRFPYLRTTRLFKFFAERKIKKAVLQNPQADMCVFMGYGFYNKWNKKPSLLFSDWTTAMDIQKKRKPNFLEHRIIRQEEEAINHAEYVISLFPVCCKEMKKKYPKANIHFLGGNVINDMGPFSVLPEIKAALNAGESHVSPLGGDIGGLLERKARSNKILFIGRKTTYLEAAKKLIAAYILLKQEPGYQTIELDIVGCERSDFKDLPDGVTCHGFLNKSAEQDKMEYYELLLNAKVLVNANPKWGAFSSTVEAMYYYTPVIVSPYQDFVKNFGDEMEFGVYNKNFTDEGIMKDMMSVFKSVNYKDMCESAHEKVKTYTWENYVERLLKTVEDSSLL